MLTSSLLKYRLHIFDLDDTLINTTQSYRHALFSLLKQYAKVIGITDLPESQALLQKIISIVGSTNTQLYWKLFLAQFPSQLGSDFIAKLEREYYALFYATLQAYPSASKWLTYLQKQGKTLALASNGSPIYQKTKLACVKLDAYFSTSFTLFSAESKEIEAKPSPTMLHTLCKLSCIQENNAVFYGNHLTDLLASKLANISFILYGSIQDEPALPFAKPDSIFSSWEDLFT